MDSLSFTLILPYLDSPTNNIIVRFNLVEEQELNHVKDHIIEGGHLHLKKRYLGSSVEG